MELHKVCYKYIEILCFLLQATLCSNKCLNFSYFFLTVYINISERIFLTVCTTQRAPSWSLTMFSLFSQRFQARRDTGPSRRKFESNGLEKDKQSCWSTKLD